MLHIKCIWNLRYRGELPLLYYYNNNEVEVRSCRRDITKYTFIYLNKVIISFNIMLNVYVNLNMIYNKMHQR